MQSVRWLIICVQDAKVLSCERLKSAEKQATCLDNYSCFHRISVYQLTEKNKHSDVYVPGKFRATQAFMCLAFIGYIAAWLLMFISIRSDSRSKYYVIASIVCPFVVGKLSKCHFRLSEEVIENPGALIPSNIHNGKLFVNKTEPVFTLLHASSETQLPVKSVTGSVKIQFICLGLSTQRRSFEKDQYDSYIIAICVITP